MSIPESMLRDFLKKQDNSTFDERIKRRIDLEHHTLIGHTYFSAASTECLECYFAGHFIATVMMVQAVNEGILKFVAVENNINTANFENKEQLISELKKQNIITENCANASLAIYRSYRNDIHHMNPKVKTIDFEKLAQSNIERLVIIEKEIWGYTADAGKVIPLQKKYWEITEENGESMIITDLRGMI